MRGEIPFALSIRREFEIASDTLNNEALVDALRRYKAVNNRMDFDIAKAEPFLQAVEALGVQLSKRITLQEGAVKIRLSFKGREYVLDYNFEEPGSVFILSRKDGKLIVKDCDLSSISKTLGLF
jgi:hypothetical protein